MDYRSWLQNYVNNHPDQNTRSQGQALLNVVGNDMGVDRNFLSGNVGNGGNYHKTGWFGKNTWVKGGNGALYKNDEISGINDRFKQMYYADHQAKGDNPDPRQNLKLDLGDGGGGGGNRASAAQLAEYDQNNTCTIALIGVHCSYSPLSKDCVNI